MPAAAALPAFGQLSGSILTLPLRHTHHRQQFGQITGPINRVSKVLSHALKPRLGPKKGKDVGGPWVHKALDSDDPIERPTLLDTDTMAGTEEAEPIAIAPAAATDATQKRADSVLHLGGALRQVNAESCTGSAAAVVRRLTDPPTPVPTHTTQDPAPQPAGPRPGHLWRGPRGARRAGERRRQGGRRRQGPAQGETGVMWMRVLHTQT